MKFNQLVRVIDATNETSSLRAAQGVNVAYTLRNWMIGAYIVEYEQNGEGRARYGDKLVIRLSSELNRKKIPGVSYRSLEIYKQFYRRYPQIMQTVSAQSGRKSSGALLKTHQTRSGETGTNATVLSGYPVEKALSSLSFSHFVELLKVDDPIKRAFYELEARQQRITVNNRHFHIDLVFYHRVLKCHVLIDLKTREFAHEDAGQMNFYLNYYREEQMEKGDNPPVGIILCTHNDAAEVKFATTGLPNKLFVSRYKLQLPSEKELTDFVKRDLKRIGRDG